MDFTKMTLTEIQNEMARFRKQIEEQPFPMTDGQKRRWKALQKAYKLINEWICK